MRYLLAFWTALALIYASFLAWHTPLRPPLTLEEARAIAGPGVEAAPAAFDQIFGSDDGRPFYMINLQWRRAGPLAEGDAPEGVVTAEAAASAYAARIVPMLLARGGYPVLIADRIGTLVAPDGALADFDNLSVVRYRSRRDLLELMTDPALAEALPYKWASLRGAAIAPARPVFGLGLGFAAPLILIALGLGAAALRLVILRLRAARPRPA